VQRSNSSYHYHHCGGGTVNSVQRRVVAVALPRSWEPSSVPPPPITGHGRMHGVTVPRPASSGDQRRAELALMETHVGSWLLHSGHFVASDDRQAFRRRRRGRGRGRGPARCFLEQHVLFEHD